MALSEVVISTAVAGMVAATVAAASVPLVARERLQAATHELQSTLNVSRIEAISRNRPSRFILDSDNKVLETWDTKGTTSTADDELLRRVSIPGSVSLARPDNKEAVSLDEETSDKFEVVFAADGSVSGNAGAVGLYGGGKYTMVTLHGAGSSRVATWVDGEWVLPGGETITEIPEEKWDAVRDGFEDEWTVKLDDLSDDAQNQDLLNGEPVTDDPPPTDGTTPLE